MVGDAQPKVVISVGDFVTDIVVAIPQLPAQAGAHQIASSIRLEPGGAGNFLVAGARLGLRMRALGALGDDPLGAAAVRAVAREGVELHGLIQQAGTSTTTVVVLVDEAGQHVFLGGYGVGPPMDLPDAWRAALSGGHALFASGYTLHERRLAKAALELMDLAHESGIPVFFDPGPEMAGAAPEQRAAVLRASDVLLLTEEEIPLMTGGAAGLDAAQLLLTLAHGPRMVCVKRGPHGCLIRTPDGMVEHPGFAVTARDTTAAGDSFAAAFIYAYLRSWPLADVAAFANAMGAAKVRKVGSGTQVPTAGEVRALLNEFGVVLDF